MKRLILVSLSILLILTSINVVAASNDIIQVIINGQQQTFEQDPVIKDGNTLVPLRQIFEALGATIKWDGSTKTVTAEKGETTIQLTIGEDAAYVNNEKIILEQPAEIINENSMVPLRFVSEALDAKVEWDGANKTIRITSEDNLFNAEIKNLVNAIRNNDVEKFRTLLDKGVSPNAVYYEKPVLYTAVYYKRLDLVKLLLEAGADPNTKYRRDTILEIAVDDGLTKIVEVLLGAGADPNYKSLHSSPLMSATHNGNEKIVQILLNHGADPNITNDDDDETALFNAVSYHDYGRGDDEISARMVALLLSAGADPNITNIDGDTALMIAADKGNFENVKRLLMRGANPSTFNNHGYTALDFAADNEDSEIVSLLLQLGVDPNHKSYRNETSLMFAAKSGSYQSVYLLLDAGANVKNRDIDQRTPLMYAADRGQSSIINLLIDYGAEVNLQDEDGFTALMIATNNGWTKAAHALLNAGADPKIEGNNGENLLILATDSIRFYGIDNSLIKRLLDAGLDPNVVDKEGKSPLYYLLWNKDYIAFDSIKYLIEAGANPNEQYPLNQTPLRIAFDFGTDDEITEIVALLLKAGADPNKGATHPTILMDAIDYSKVSTQYGWELPLNGIKQLLNYGADPNKRNYKNQTAMMILGQNIYPNVTNVAKALLTAGADPTATDDHGKNALMYALEEDNGHYSDRSIGFYQLLLDNGVDPNLTDNQGYTALAYATNKRYYDDINIKAIKLLINAGANPNIVIDDNDNTLFINAVKQNDYDYIKFLIDNGIDLTFHNQGERAREIAGNFYSSDIADLLDQYLK